MELKGLHKHPPKVIVTTESFYKQVIKAHHAIGTTVNKYELVVNIQACLLWQQFKGQTKKNKSDYTIHVGLLTWPGLVLPPENFKFLFLVSVLSTVDF